MVKVLIIGGSYAGFATAQKLESRFVKSGKDFTITVVTERDSFWHTVAGMRGIVLPGYAEKTYVPYDKALKSDKSKVVQGTVVSLNRESATLADGQIIPFDYVVIATGSYNHSAKGQADSKAAGAAAGVLTSSSIEKATSVLVVGGGPSAVELCGEIKELYPSKAVTLVHSGEVLVPGISEKFSARIAVELKKLGVTVVSNDRIDLAAFSADKVGAEHFSHTPRTLTTRNGVAIATDVQFLMVGNTTYNSGIVEALDASLVDDKKQIKVSPTLQLASADYPNFFASGDVCNATTQKLAYVAGQQGDVVARNIEKLVDGGKTATLAEWKPASSNMMILTLGSKGGVSQLPFGVFGSWTSSLIKSGHLFLPKQYGQLNAVWVK
ncbi:Apoptosis-inducing factor 2 [Thoreauomyces humboldtii]|nr:Apoptosis-inducing factor 2 [Thoreauomyces humboldtii]